METEIVDQSSVATDYKVCRLLENFLGGRKENTRLAYQQDLESFADFAREYVTQEGYRVDAIVNCERALLFLLGRGGGEANTMALAFKNWLVSKKGLCASTVNRRLTSIRAIVKQARLQGLVTWSVEIENLKVEPYRDTSGPGVEGVRAMMELAKRRNDALGDRDYMLIRLLFDLALRRKEVAGLDVDDVDLRRSRIAVLGKGRDSKEWITLPKPTKESIERWLEHRGHTSGPLLTNFQHNGDNSKRLYANSIYRIVKGYGERLGLDVRPHALRHAAITAALDGCGDLRKVQRFSRHKDPRTLLIYDDNRNDMAGEISTLVAGSVS